MATEYRTPANAASIGSVSVGAGSANIGDLDIETFEPSADVTMQSAAVATGNGTVLAVTGYGSAIVQITGPFVGTITFEGTVNGTDFTSLSATLLGAATIATTATAAGIYRLSVTGLTSIRARISAYTSGSITVVGRATNAPYGPKAVAISGSVITSNGGTFATQVTSIAAGENVLGKVAGSALVVIPTITVDTAAYASGDSIGGKITLANAVRVSGGSSLLYSIHIFDRSNTKPTGNILIFNADPTAATITDNAAFVYSTDDFKQITRIPVASSDYVTINGKASAGLVNIGRMVKAASGTTLYAAFPTDGAPDFVATSDLQIIFNFIPVD